jgi:N-hydroxyarylamine O-acetyltransferase
VRTSLRDAYLHRIGLPAEPGPADLPALRRLHAAHVAAIPFENLDILLGRGIRLEPDRLREKLIEQRRGGYCFEQNGLFADVLQQLGFAATPLEARVRTGASTVLPRTHMLIRVEFGLESWLADVGFGGEGPREPVPMNGSVSEQSAGLAYRVIREGDAHVLQMRRDGTWGDQYAFLMQPVFSADFQMANWFTSTFPASPFVRTLTAQRATHDARYVLRYPWFTEIRDTGTNAREIDRSELLPMLREVFLIDLPDGTVFPAVDGAVTT